MNDFRINWHRSINFGDQLNPYIVKYFLGFVPEKYEIWNQHLGKHLPLTSEHIMLLGSILNEANEKTTVIGAGFVSSDSVCLKEPNFLAVRGNLTLERVNFLYGEKNNIFIGDPAISLPKIFPNRVEKKFKLGIIPHLIDEDYVRSSLKNLNKNYRVISLKINSFDDIERIITEIQECELTLSSSLHGIIVSHVYDIPCLWVEFSDRVIGNGFKFKDYFSGHSQDFENFNPISLKENLTSNLIMNLSPNLFHKSPITKNQIEENFSFYSEIFKKFK